MRAGARGTAPLRREQRRNAAIAIAGVAGALTMAEPTGTLVVDQLWCAALAAAGAAVATSARRGPLLVAASVAVLATTDLRSLVPAVLGLGCAVAATSDLRRASPFLRGLAGGGAVCALLVASGHDRQALSAVAGWLGVALPLLGSAARQVAPATRRRAATVAGLVAGAAVLCCLVAGFGAATARQQLDEGVAALDRGLVAAKGGDVELAREELHAAAESLATAADDLGRWGIATRLVPGASQNVDAAVSLLRGGADAAAAAETASAVLDNDALTIDGGRLDLDAVAEVAAPLEDLVASLTRTAEQVDEARQLPLLPPVRDRLERVAPDLEQALHDARIGADAARVVPAMLGADGPRRYLVLLTSPAEARGRFGFPAAYAVVAADDGDLELEVAESIGRLQGVTTADQSAMPVDDPQVVPYVDFAATANWRSVTIPPDFPTVATIARELWRQTGTGEIDGVLRLDTTSLGALVQLTGPVTVEGRAAPLDGAQLTRYLDFDQYVEFGDDAALERHEVLEDLAGSVFDQLLASDLPGPRGLADALGPMVDQGHLELVSFDEGEQAFLDAIELTGRFDPPTTPDAFALAGVNATGNKIDAFLRREVAYEATVADDGSIEATMLVALHNDAPASGLPDYVIGSALEGAAAPPKGTNFTFVLVWSALPLVSATADGADIAAVSSATGGWYLHVFALSLPPESTVGLVLELAGAPAVPGPYALTVLPGGGSTPDLVRATVTDGAGATVVAIDPTPVVVPTELGG